MRCPQHVLVLVLLLAFGGHVLSLCDDGRWIPSGTAENFGDAGLGFLLAKDISLLCPADTFMHSCFFHGATQRASGLLKRKWVADGAGCREFSPVRFLKAIANRRLFLIGDSTMMQTFQSFVCSFHSITKTDLQVDWYHHQGGTIEVPNRVYDTTTCPLQGKHCHLSGGVMRFADFNASVIFRGISQYTHRGFFKEILADGTNIDIVILNWGLHLNDKSIFEEQVKLLAHDLVDIHNSPTIFVRESFATHFSGRMNQSGYFDTSHNIDNRKCLPLSGNSSHIRSFDWRNMILEERLNASLVKIIPVAKAMYSQWDAHVDGDSRMVHFHRADCVHYCAQSAVFTFIKQITQNYIESYVPQVVDGGKLSLREGDLFRPTTSRTVYLMQNAKLRPFLNLQSFQRSGRDFAEVNLIQPAQFENMEIGNAMR